LTFGREGVNLGGNPGGSMSLQLDFTNPYASARAPVMGRNVVSTSQPLAAQAGLRMLLKGGNAVDAAIAAAMTLTVVEPSGNGLGSDAFAILWDGKELHGLNASGRSPAAWTPERFAGMKTMPERGWDSVTVPGVVSAWVALSKRFGKLPFAVLAEPAIHYARYGFAVTPAIGTLWGMAAKLLAEQPGFAEAFLPEGRAPKVGEVFRNEPLAKSLEAIAETEGAAFYTGQLAEEIAAHAAAHGAAMSLDDLGAHEADWCGTISSAIGDKVVHEIPPNGQGIATLMALRMIHLGGIASQGVDSVHDTHLAIEATKLALVDTARFVADLDAMRDVTPAMMLDDDYLAGRIRGTDLSRAGDPAHGDPKPGGTVYLAAADRDGMMVSFIQSNYMGFGSGVVVPGTGISMQNRGYGFSLDSRLPNIVAPRKRPFQTIIPGFAMDGKTGKPIMAFGVMGGPMQAQGHLQMALRVLVAGQNPQAAADAPRWRVLAGRRVAVEASMPVALREGLEALGHEIIVEPPAGVFGFGGAQLIHVGDDGTYVAGSDPRKDGQAVAF
jgi:gamma-glutamyltranspeptidase / glutathione hydrolase